MSKYVTVTEAQFKDKALLLASLADLGYGEGQVRVAAAGQHLPLYGYQGDRRAETAAIVIDRRHLAGSSNDLGFAFRDGTFVPIISEYDLGRYEGGRKTAPGALDRKHGGDFLAQLRTAYNKRVVEQIKRRVRGSARQVQEGSTIKIVVSY